MAIREFVHYLWRNHGTSYWTEETVVGRFDETQTGSHLRQAGGILTPLPGPRAGKTRPSRPTSQSSFFVAWGDAASMGEVLGISLRNRAHEAQVKSTEDGQRFSPNGKPLGPNALKAITVVTTYPRIASPEGLQAPTREHRDI
ncbi:MAG: hypothetical protein NZ899_12105 [Thermoguttaceae bacterium]|nr:hypothetical protein [Thermoguttaceae bacterium]MDW8079575.1 hypothetical protein [Thermoguttaceae bacterium]